MIEKISNFINEHAIVVSVFAFALIAFNTLVAADTANLQARIAESSLALSIPGLNVDTGSAITNIQKDGISVTNTTTGANTTINRNANGSVNLNTNADGASTTINKNSDGSVIINSNSGDSSSTITRSSNGSVNFSANSDGSVVNMYKDASGQSYINIPGTTISAKEGEANLKIMIDRGAIIGSDRSVVVNLEGGSVSLIKTSDDFTTYKDLVIQSRPWVTNVSSNNGSVIVSYNQPGRFLGIFKSNLNATVNVSNNGQVKVKFPWYSFLYSKDTKTIEDRVSLNISNASGSKLIQISSIGTTNSSVSIQDSAKVVNIVSSTIDASSTTTIQVTPTPAKTVTCVVPSEFPFANYTDSVYMTPNSLKTSVIARNLDMQINSIATLAVASTLQQQLNAKLTTAYVFDSITAQKNVTITNLYVSDTAQVIIASGFVGNVTKMSKADLIRKAMLQLGLLGAECNY